MKYKEEFDLAYTTIKDYYGTSTASRSGVPLINHIDGGLLYMKELYSTYAEMSAYCLHPIVQNDQDLKKNMNMLLAFSPLTVMLVMEYRNTANAYLCRPNTDLYEMKNLPNIPIDGVRRMLIADKRQNQKDFLKYHKDSHARSEQLARYFKLWLRHLYNMKDES